MTNIAIKVEDLRKSYGHKEVLHGIDLEVQEGEIFALLGPNGAGKTTTVEILEGHRSRNNGNISVLGHDPANGKIDFKQRTGIVLQQTGVEPYLTVKETLDLFAGFYPNPRPVENVMEVTGLIDLGKTRVRKLSGGQQRRLDVAVGLTGDPELLFLDEPTTGFDPSARRNAWEMIRKLQSIGKTIFLTTHYMDEAEYLSDRVAIIVNGKIIATGSPNELTKLNKTTTITFRINQPEIDLPEKLFDTGKNEDGLFIMQTDVPQKLLYELTQWAMKSKILLDDIKVSRSTLEETYLELVNPEHFKSGQ